MGSSDGVAFLGHHPQQTLSIVFFLFSVGRRSSSLIFGTTSLRHVSSRRADGK